MIELLNRSETSSKVFVKSQRTSSGSFINDKHEALFGPLTLSLLSFAQNKTSSEQVHKAFLELIGEIRFVNDLDHSSRTN